MEKQAHKRRRQKAVWEMAVGEPLPRQEIVSYLGQQLLLAPTVTLGLGAGRWRAMTSRELIDVVSLHVETCSGPFSKRMPNLDAKGRIPGNAAAPRWKFLAFPATSQQVGRTCPGRRL